MKKQPAKIYSKQTKSHPILGTLAEESNLRRQAWLRHGCNAFDSVNPTSQPLSFWTEQDILQYIVENKLEICSVYGNIVPTNDQVSLEGKCDLKCTGCQRTGCVWCAFGAHHDKESRFIRLRETHPNLYNYCMRGGNGLTIRPMWQMHPNMTESGKTGTLRRSGCHPGKDLAWLKCSKW